MMSGPLLMNPSAPVNPAWARAGLQWALLVLALLVAAHGTVASMVEIWWRSGTFNHAFAVPVISGWLAWRVRHRWLALQPQADARWWPALVVLSGLVLFSDAALANAPGHFALVGLLVVSVPAVLGTAVARALAFPLGFAFFMVPFGEFLIPQMMEATATFTVVALQFTGVPVFREGLNFVIPSGQWSVVEACSGIRYLMASACVGALYAHITYAHARKRWAFFAVSLAVPIVANWLRAYLIVMLGHLSDNRIATGADHLVYGWFFFGVIIMAMFAVGARWADPVDSVLGLGAAHPGPGTRPGAGAPPQAQSMSLSWASLALCMALAVLPLLGGQWMRAAAPVAPEAQAPLAGAGWQAPQLLNMASGPWAPLFLEPDAQSLWVYSSPEPAGSLPVYLHLTQYRQQTHEHKLLSSENRLLKTADTNWQLGAGLTQTLVVQAQGRALALAPQVLIAQPAALATGAPPHLMVLQLVRVGGQWQAMGWPARLAMAWARMRGGVDEGLAWTVYTPLGNPQNQADVQAATQRLQTFVQAALGAAEAQLP